MQTKKTLGPRITDPRERGATDGTNQKTKKLLIH